MDAKEFLRAVWPTKGHYCLATLFKPEPGKTAYVHKAFDSIDAAADFISSKRARTTDVYFAVHSLEHPRVWDPEKWNYKTREKGAYRYRTQDNMLCARAFFFDLDVGDTKDYATQGEAAKALMEFVNATGLPKPMVTSSGGGLHVYWLVADDIPSVTWRETAKKLRSVAEAWGLRADPSRTTDTASVLRVVGTQNFKDPENPRPVKALRTTEPVKNDEFLSAVDAAAIKFDVKPEIEKPKSKSIFDDVEGNLETGPPVSLKSVAAVCGQMQNLIRKQGRVSEPEWYSMLQLVRHVENSDHWVHKLSEGHPSYDYGETEAKVQQLTDGNIGPTTCEKFHRDCDPKVCEACPLWGKIKSPIVAARYKDPAPEPEVTVQTSPATPPQKITIPNPPPPYTRLKNSGGVSKEVVTADGETTNVKFLELDLYPLRRLKNYLDKTERQEWRAVIPREGDVDFEIEAATLYDMKALMGALSSAGVYVKPGNAKDTQDYMVAYINQLQREADAETQCNHLGWVNDDRKEFILPDRIMSASGSRPAHLGRSLANISDVVTRKGTLQGQIDLMKFYNHPRYIRHQYFMVNSLASVVLHPTNIYGAVINASGEPGASKSTALYAASGFWGKPERYPFSGLSSGSTQNARYQRMANLSNLPMCVDEITRLGVSDAKELALAVSQPNVLKNRLYADASERPGSDGLMASLMLTTSNNSLHGLLAMDNSDGTAGSMRVFEIVFHNPGVHMKWEADEFLRHLGDNYGHIGPAFVEAVLRDPDTFYARITELQKLVDEKCNITSGERFWSADIAAVTAAAELSNKEGLLSFPAEHIFEWATTEQINEMRGVVKEEYSSPIHLVADYLEHITQKMIVTDKSGFQNMGNTSSLGVTIIREPRGELCAHFDKHKEMMWVLKKDFKDYCSSIGANHRKILHDLNNQTAVVDGRHVPVIPEQDTKKVLGAGTEYAKSQSRCFMINMAHPDISGAVELDVVGGRDHGAQTAPKGDSGVGN